MFLGGLKLYWQNTFRIFALRLLGSVGALEGILKALGYG